MTVASLIKCLEGMDPEVDVYISANNSDFAVTVEGVEYDDDGMVVIHSGGN